MTRTRYKIYENAPHFLTCTVVNWMPIFSNPENATIVLDAISWLQKENRMKLFGYVLMENHLHLIASSESLGKTMAGFKSYTARCIIDRLQKQGENSLLAQISYFKLPHKVDREYQLWQEGSHPQLIQYKSMMLQKLTYIHHNPVRRGYVEEPAHWRYSSARNYEGMSGIIPVTVEW
ncbi:MAG: transposase [Smithella sp.]